MRLRSRACWHAACGDGIRAESYVVACISSLALSCAAVTLLLQRENHCAFVLHTGGRGAERPRAPVPPVDAGGLPSRPLWGRAGERGRELREMRRYRQGILPNSPARRDTLC